MPPAKVLVPEPLLSNRPVVVAPETARNSPFTVEEALLMNPESKVARSPKAAVLEALSAPATLRLLFTVDEAARMRPTVVLGVK